MVRSRNRDDKLTRVVSWRAGTGTMPPWLIAIRKWPPLRSRATAKPAPTPSRFGLPCASLFVSVWASIVVAKNQRSPRGARATLVALIIGYEAGLAALIALYLLVWGEPSSLWLYLVSLAGAGLAIELPILWWRKRKGELV